MDEIQGFVLSIVSSAGVSVTLSGLLIWLFRGWITERLKNSIKHEYDLKLSTLNSELSIKVNAQAEQLKAEIEKEADNIRFATSTIGESQKITIKRKMEGIDALWSAVLACRKNIPPVMGFLDILTEEEYLESRNHPQFKRLAGKLSIESLTDMFFDERGSFERYRPYVGEYLWATFSIYQSLILRISFLISMVETDPDKLRWFKDGGVRQLLKASLTEEEIIKFDEMRIAKVNFLQNTYEAKILQAMDKVISGQTFGKEALKQAQEMEKMAQEIKGHSSFEQK